MSLTRAGSRPGPRLAVWLLLASLGQAALGCELAALCRDPCCTVSPNCRQAETLVCSCPPGNMDIKAGDIPASVNSIRISQLASLTISVDALYELRSLKSVSLKDIGDVIVEKGGFFLHGSNSLRTLNVIGIDTFYADTRAFTGNWRDSTSITLEDIGRLNISTKSFSYTSYLSGPRIMIRNVTTLAVASGAFNSFIGKLELDNIHMKDCHWGTFNEKIEMVSLSGVNISEVKTQCFHNVGRLSKGLRLGVFIRSSSLGSVSSQGFSGNISTLELKDDTNIGTIQEHGFQVHVKDFNMMYCNIGTLHSKGLSISSTDKLSITNMGIKYLQKNALLGLRVIPSPRRYRSVTLGDLEIGNAEAGSLALPACLPADISRLHIPEAYSERCPTEKRARRLLGADGRRALYSAEYKVFDSLMDLEVCDQKGETMPERVDEDKKCPSPENGEKEERDYDKEMETEGQSRTDTEVKSENEGLNLEGDQARQAGEVTSGIKDDTEMEHPEKPEDGERDGDVQGSEHERSDRTDDEGPDHSGHPDDIQEGHPGDDHSGSDAAPMRSSPGLIILAVLLGILVFIILAVLVLVRNGVLEIRRPTKQASDVTSGSEILRE